MATAARFTKRLSTGLRRTVASSLLVLLSLASGCDSEKALTQKCIRGDTEACRGACEKGALGEGGCFPAAQGALREAQADYEGPEWLRASNLFRKSCDGGYADGCLFAAQMIETPFGQIRLSKAVKPEIVAIGDSAIDERRQWLERGCKLEHAGSCRRLGDVTIGKKSDVATSAYDRACVLGTAAAECKKARKHEVAVFEAYRSACRREVADSCTALGNLVHRVDFPRAVRLFLAEGEVRGVFERAGGKRAFVEQRAREASTASVTDPTQSEPPSTRPDGVTVQMGRPTVSGRLAAPLVGRALEIHEPRLAACMAGAAPGTKLELTAKLVVDRTGDVWSATALPPHEPITGCVGRVLESVVMQPPVSDTAEVTQPIVLAASPGRPDGGTAEAPGAGGAGGARGASAD